MERLWLTQCSLKKCLGCRPQRKEEYWNVHKLTSTEIVHVKSVDEYSSKAERLGGKVVVPKTAIPGMGYYAVCLDTENNSFGIFESGDSVK